MNGRITARALGVWCVALALAFAMVHVVFAALIGWGGMALGAVAPDLAPLYAYWNPHLRPGLIVPVVCVIVYLRVLRRVDLAPTWSDSTALAFFMAAFLAMALSVPLIDGGPRVWIGPFASRSDIEYYGAIDRVGNVRDYFRDYVEQSASFPMHSRTHPPGAVLLLAALTRALGGGPWAASLGAIGFSSLAVPLVFWLGRSIGGPALGRRACALFVVTPSVVLFTATSMDGPFMVVLVATLWAFWRALQQTPLRMGLLAGLLAAAAVLLTYSTALVLVFCALAWAATLCARPAGWRRLMLAGLAAVAGFVAAYFGLWLATGFDPVAMLRAAIAQDHRIMSGTRHESGARHLALAVGNLAAFGMGVGLPVLALWTRGVLRAARGARPIDPGSLGLFTLCGTATVLIGAVLPVYSLEVERIWMFLTPLALMPAAGALIETDDVTPRAATFWAITILAGQTIVTEVLLGTYW
jgi:hypothetical protein